MRAALAALASLLLSACVTVGLGGDAPAQAQYRLHDPGVPTARRAAPVVPALLIQSLPADATADALSIAYSAQAQRFAYYQLASWTERPVRQLPRLLQRRLEATGLAGAVGLVGDPMRADWLLTVAIETLHHDVSQPPGSGRLALSVELFDRRSRTRLARRQFDIAVPTPRADAEAAAAALSAAVAQAFDALVPWLEVELQQASAKPAR